MPGVDEIANLFNSGASKSCGPTKVSTAGACEPRLNASDDAHPILTTAHSQLQQFKNTPACSILLLSVVLRC